MELNSETRKLSPALDDNGVCFALILTLHNALTIYENLLAGSRRLISIVQNCSVKECSGLENKLRLLGFVSSSTNDLLLGKSSLTSLSVSTLCEMGILICFIIYAMPRDYGYELGVPEAMPLNAV